MKSKLKQYIKEQLRKHILNEKQLLTEKQCGCPTSYQDENGNTVNGYTTQDCPGNCYSCCQGGFDLGILPPAGTTGGNNKPKNPRGMSSAEFHKMNEIFNRRKN
jgi:hypothetical protein